MNKYVQEWGPQALQFGGRDPQVVITAQIRAQLRKTARQAAKKGDREAAREALVKLRKVKEGLA